MILEQILAELQKLNANLANGVGLPASTAQALSAPLAQQNAPQTQLQNTAVNTTLPNGQPITPEAITALIQPHVSNDAIKTDLGTAMRGMGINALPETQPHQLVALYNAFMGVIHKHTGGAGAAQQPPASII